MVISNRLRLLSAVAISRFGLNCLSHLFLLSWILIRGFKILDLFLHWLHSVPMLFESSSMVPVDIGRKTGLRIGVLLEDFLHLNG